MRLQVPIRFRRSLSPTSVECSDGGVDDKFKWGGGIELRTRFPYVTLRRRIMMSNLAVTAEGEPSNCKFPQNVPFDPTCPPSNIQHPVQSFNKEPGKFEFGIVDGEGLVLTNIHQPNISDKLSVTHFKLDEISP